VLRLSAVRVLQADSAAEQHLQRFNPGICGQDAVVNRGLMTLSGFVVGNDLKAKLDYGERLAVSD